MKIKSAKKDKSRVAQRKQDKIFVTGEVFPIDIDLLILARVHITPDNINYF